MKNVILFSAKAKAMDVEASSLPSEYENSIYKRISFNDTYPALEQANVKVFQWSLEDNVLALDFVEQAEGVENVFLTIQKYIRTAKETAKALEEKEIFITAPQDILIVAEPWKYYSFYKTCEVMYEEQFVYALDYRIENINEFTGTGNPSEAQIISWLNDSLPGRSKAVLEYLAQEKSFA